MRVIESPLPEVWNRYLEGRAHGSVLHRAEWEQVFAVYGLPMLRLAAEREGKIVGILPLVWQKSLLFGNQLVSLPWFDAVSVLADDADAREQLIASAQAAARARGNAILQLRQAEPLEPAYPVRNDKVLMRLALESDPETLWKRLSAKVRNQVRKGQKSELELARGGRELAGEFFDVYSANMRDLGSPSHKRKFFERVLDQFGNLCTIHLAKIRGRAVGAGFTIANGQRLEIPWASSLREFNGMCVNHVMYWEILADACRNGFAWFHFGRSSRDSGTYHFKKQWGADDVPLFWYHLADTRNAEHLVASPQDSFGWAQRVWRRLPLWLARRLGPQIISKVP